MASPSLTVLCAGALRGVLDELAPRFERRAECRVSVACERSERVAARVLAGEPIDVVVTTAECVADLVRGDAVLGDGVAAVAAAAIGLAVRAGAARPDIGSVAAFTQTLLDAGPIAIADPATGSPSANHFTAVLERLGIAGRVLPKCRLVGPSEGSVVVCCEAVASGDAEIGIQQISEILAVPGVDLVGPLPGELQKTTVFCAAVGARAGDPGLARRLVAFLTSADAVPVIRAKGLDRPV